jgi:hypothetical protein
MQKLNVSHGKAMMDKMERKGGLHCVRRCIECESFVMRSRCQWKYKKKVNKKQRIGLKGKRDPLPPEAELEFIQGYK